jgi:ABC-type thiamine transport system ATPase subunit
MTIDLDITRTSAVRRTPRVVQVEGMFDLQPLEHDTLVWKAPLELPDRWHVGAIVGPSGSGKTTVARAMAQPLGGRVVEAKDADGNLAEPFAWPADESLVDGFPEAIGTDTICETLSAVGFGSTPNWRRPYRVLSNGEQFRVNLARAMLESDGAPVFMDEFASLVNDQVAKAASTAAAKATRRRGGQLVAVTWRTDILESLEPDWVLFCDPGQTLRLQHNVNGQSRRWVRPGVAMVVRGVHPAAWSAFREHHYLDHHLGAAAVCFVGLVADQPAAFCATYHFPNHYGLNYREHRLVCLPDFQGAGVGMLLSNFVAAMYVAKGATYYSTSSHPAVIAYRNRSDLWDLVRHGFATRQAGATFAHKDRQHSSAGRITAAFQYVGPTTDAIARHADRFGVHVNSVTTPSKPLTPDRDA